jgi:predicted DNA-binding transcriptional regulator AlpA
MERMALGEAASEELVSPRRARAMCGDISESTRRRLTDFPSPVVLGRNSRGKATRIAFVRSELEAWIAQRIKGGRSGAGA